MSLAASTTLSATRPASSKPRLITMSTASSDSGSTALRERSGSRTSSGFFRRARTAAGRRRWPPGQQFDHRIRQRGRDRFRRHRSHAGDGARRRGRRPEAQLGPEASDAPTMHLLVLYHGVLTLSRSRTPFDEMAEVIRAEFGRLKQLRDRGERSLAANEIP